MSLMIGETNCLASFLLNFFWQGVKIIKNNLPCFSISDKKPNFKSLFVHLCLINYWISQSGGLNWKDYMSLSNRCLS